VNQLKNISEKNSHNENTIQYVSHLVSSSLFGLSTVLIEVYAGYTKPYTMQINWAPNQNI